MLRLFDAARRAGLDFLLEVIPSKVGAVDDTTTAQLLQRFYDIGVRPDWWKLEPMLSDVAWRTVCEMIERRDPWCRGIVVLGLGESEANLAASFAAAARHERVKGFAVGRTIHAEPGRAWLSGEIGDEEAVTAMSDSFARLCRLWDDARANLGVAA